VHITTLELAFCRTAEEIEEIKETLKPAIPTIASYTYQHRARLVKPMISYDLSAFALSFLPAAGEPVVSPPPVAPDNAAVIKQGDSYTYHHLRRDVWNQAKESGITVDSRYIVPSAHITLGRYLTHDDHATPEQRKKWVEAIDEINKWLENEVWGRSDADVVGEWVVGQEKGLDVRLGTLWVSNSRSHLPRLSQISVNKANTDTECCSTVEAGPFFSVKGFERLAVHRLSGLTPYGMALSVIFWLFVRETE
jgi:hypothetical protein